MRESVITDNSPGTPVRVTFGFKEGFMFGLGLAVPLLVLSLILLGMLLNLP